MTATGGGVLDLEEAPYTARLEHVTGTELYIDTISFHPDAAAKATTWGNIKDIYE